MAVKLRDIAEAIIHDWNGAQYSKDPDILGHFLQEHCVFLTKGEPFASTARMILDDLIGPRTFLNQTRLTKFLQERLGMK